MEDIDYNTIEKFYNGEQYDASDIPNYENEIDPEQLYEELYPDIKIHKDFPKDIINLNIEKAIDKKNKPLFEKEKSLEEGDLYLGESKEGNFIYENTPENLEFLKSQREKLYENLTIRQFFQMTGTTFFEIIYDLMSLNFDKNILENLKYIVLKDDRMLSISIVLFFIVFLLALVFI